MIKFQVSTRWSGRLRTIKVEVHDTVQEMRAAGEAYSKRLGLDQDGFVGAHGLAQSADWMSVSAGGRVRRLPLAGYIRLYKGALAAGLISHEATHIAWAIYKQDIGKTVPDMAREEKLCYLVGDISAKIVHKLYQYDAYEETN